MDIVYTGKLPPGGHLDIRPPPLTEVTDPAQMIAFQQHWWGGNAITWTQCTAPAIWIDPSGLTLANYAHVKHEVAVLVRDLADDTGVGFYLTNDRTAASIRVMVGGEAPLMHTTTSDGERIFQLGRADVQYKWSWSQREWAFTNGTVWLASEVLDRKIDQQRVLLRHEFGHIIGLTHVSDPTATMSPLPLPRSSDWTGPEQIALRLAYPATHCQQDV